ncbi:hypothetical protein IAU59_007124 [Kwoniella sp. CBS 9459]
MRSSTSAFMWSSILMMLGSSAAAANPQPDEGSAPSVAGTLAPRDEEVKMAPLCDKDGPKVADVSKGEYWHWDSYWFSAVAGALANANKDLLRKVWDENSKDGDEVDKTKFNLYNYNGDVQSIEYSWADVENQGEADYSSETRIWWLAGAEMAAMKLGGYLGLDSDQIAWGSPVDAFKILTGKTAVMEQIGDDPDRFFELVKNATSTPTIFGLGADPGTDWGFEPWNWYTILRVDDDKFESGGSDSDYEYKHLIFWDSNLLDERDPFFKDVHSKIKKVVYCEECKF